MSSRTLVHALEEKIMGCWAVTDDIKVVYEELLNDADKMSADEISNILVGLASLYNRKFERLWGVFDDVCEHGGIWLDEELVTVAKQHRDYGEKLNSMFEEPAPTESKFCEKRDNMWFCTSLEDYNINKFKNAVPAKEYRSD